ncbi:DUF6292 family protein [Streptomyces sp. RKAG293]|uniref:DUF6292 family protein n=1 Tax=Streptomyces sp. RKAG293 TaxID=2893403 RepID=UPI00203396B4|nr:DUF6292 family protein [Streptomyces sp. RKAG293]MCM2424149.1 DUF6292 family protein [Streptomyces sp. RKAG293]
MIRAGRRKYAQTMADLASALGMPLGTFRNKKPHAQEGHPAPISSPNSRALLWDAEQTKAFYAGKPIPQLPAEDCDEDLLDRHEAAAELGVSPASWNKYKHEPKLAEHVVRIPASKAGEEGTEHWPRHIVRAFKAARPGKGQSPTSGRPKGSGDMVPREEILPRIAELLDLDPAVTAAAVVDELKVAMTTAMSGLAQLRGRRIADVLEAEPQLTAEEAAEQLGYPVVARRRALAVAAAEQRARQVRPYLQRVADALAAAGAADPMEVEVQQLPGEYLAVAVPLSVGQPAPALVWDERYGWRTATSRRHPLGKESGTPPEGEGIRYLGSGLQPRPDELLDALGDGRKGSKGPKVRAV